MSRWTKDPMRYAALAAGSVLALTWLVACSGTATSTTSTSPPETSNASASSASPATTPDAMMAPEGFAMGPDGDIYFSDCPAQRVFRLDHGGIEVVAGSGPQGLDYGGFSGDGGPATEARVNCPAGLAFDRRGDLFVADTVNNRVRMIDPKGVISTIAGSGPTGLDAGTYVGDGGPATEAQLNFPNGLAVDAAGNVYIADHGNDAVRKVDTHGDITTIAGTGDGGYSGDGGQATRAELHGPWYIVLDARRNVYFTEKENGVVRKVDARGTITTVAGTGRITDSGDGGAAIDAGFAEAYGLALDAKGNLYVSDDVANVVREIDTHGIISTVAGTGKPGLAGDGGPAIAAQLNMPFGLLIDPAGGLLIADGGNGCVREIDPQATIHSVVCA
jgi:sugar lactone lactonase YvrE